MQRDDLRALDAAYRDRMNALRASDSEAWWREMRAKVGLRRTFWGNAKERRASAASFRAHFGRFRVVLGDNTDSALARQEARVMMPTDGSGQATKEILA